MTLSLCYFVLPTCASLSHGMPLDVAITDPLQPSHKDLMITQKHFTLVKTCKYLNSQVPIACGHAWLETFLARF